MIGSHLQQHLQLRYLEEKKIRKKVVSWPPHPYFPVLHEAVTVCPPLDSPYRDKEKNYEGRGEERWELTLSLISHGQPRA